ncbi:probable sodium-coupled neutral amino acid transporter 6 isoform X1 [Strongylocentrotus purpuratus]|uniref:Amino acid transporter transmembrane domain-containing protein n=1 Tax=Strongylocentrotus purpuratus TaxID=7668 RepID=A0A7M7LSK9_STRPU|nr:probable sodium-coupled neutral amino acid transporter 6 isoform X1 [Strongylocentrotus purpuratus]|eukprot:XP_011662530.1 PREDICTED: probable sodium-coupled neutral amino acid transporter 6 isoform X1 [Strongylocentrotus purpuratus]
MESKCHRLVAGRVEDANDQSHDLIYHGIVDDTPLLPSTSVQEAVTERVEPVAYGKTSFGLSVFNLMNAILGSGILGLPFAMAQSGIILFSLMLLVVAMMANYTIHLLLKMCDITGHRSYEDIGNSAMGVPGKLMAACAILLQNIGAMSSYLFIVKNEMPAVLKTFLHEDQSANSEWYVNGDYLVLLLVFFIILPLACLPKIGFLGYTSAFSILCMVFFTVGIVYKKFGFPCPIPITPGPNGSLENTLEDYMYYSPKDNQSDQCKAELFSITLQTAYTIPTMAFSFVCHTAVLPIYAELSRPTKRRMQNVTITSIGVCYTLYMIASLFGYLTFYEGINSEILHGYSLYQEDDLLLLIIRIAVLTAIVFTVPIIHYPARLAFMMIAGTVFPLLASRTSWKLYFLTTFILISVVTTFAICIPNIMEIFGVIGATASTSLVLFLPSLFYLKLGREELSSPSKIMAIILLVVSVALLILSLTTIIYGIVTKDTLT